MCKGNVIVVCLIAINMTECETLGEVHKIPTKLILNPNIISSFIFLKLSVLERWAISITPVTM